MPSNQTEKLASPLSVLPEAEHNAYENIFYRNQHVLGWVLSALNSATRVISGTINAGQIQGLKVLFNLLDGTREVISFPDTDISVGENRKIYYADYITETILSVELPGFEDFIPDENEFPIVHAVRYQDTAVTTADRLEWIAPRTDIYAHVPIGKIIALHPYATDPDSYFFKFCDGTGTLGDNFPGHETDPIPNLTDDRFLMGGSGYGTGGSNTLLDHTHGCGTESADHSHSTSIGSATSGGRSASHTHDTQYAGTHSHALHYIADGAWGVSTASVGYNGTILNTNSPQMTTTGSDGSHYHSGFAEATDHTHSVDFGNKQSGGVSASHNHVIGSGSAPTSTSNLPQYFKVKYYLKTN